MKDYLIGQEVREHTFKMEGKNINEDLRRMGITIPTIIEPQQIAGLPSSAVTQAQGAIDEVQPKVYKKQKWFRDYNSMIQWRSQNGINDFVMVQMKKPYRGYRYQLHYNSNTVTNKSRGIAR